MNDNHENPVGEFILGSALPAKSLTRQRLAPFGDDDILFKDENDIIFHSHKREPNEPQGEKGNIISQLLPTVKSLMHLWVASQVPFMKGPEFDGQSFTLKQPDKADLALLMFALIFQVHVIEQLED